MQRSLAGAVSVGCVLLGCAASPSRGDGGLAEASQDASADAVVLDEVAMQEASLTEDAGPEDAAAPVDALPPQDVAPAEAGGGTPDYTMPGPLSPLVLAPRMVTMPSSTGCTGADCNLVLRVTMPSGAGPRSAPFPLVVFSNGFQVPASQYQSYAFRLARWGYTVLQWDTTSEGGLIPRSITHRVLAAMLRALPSQLGAEAAMTDTHRVVFAGHSRGGKLSALAAQNNPDAVGLVGLDPVDAPPPMTPAGPDYPSATAGLGAFAGASVFVGSALGGQAAPSAFGMACAPAANNFTVFYNAARAPSLEATLAQTGHMQFLDDQAHCPSTALGTLCSICVAGTTPDSAVREASQVLLVALAESATRGIDASAYLRPGGAWLAAQTILTARAR